MNSRVLLPSSRRTKYLSCARPTKVSLVSHVTTSYLQPLIAKILSQIENSSETVPVEIIARPKGKDVVSDAFPRFLALYTSAKTVGTLPKENPSGKFVSEWQALVAEAPTKPELVDVTPAYSSFMSIKDKDELVRIPSKLSFIVISIRTLIELVANLGILDFYSSQLPCRSQVRKYS